MCQKRVEYLLDERTIIPENKERRKMGLGRIRTGQGGQVGWAGMKQQEKPADAKGLKTGTVKAEIRDEKGKHLVGKQVGHGQNKNSGLLARVGKVQESLLKIFFPSRYWKKVGGISIRLLLAYGAGIFVHFSQDSLTLQAFYRLPNTHFSYFFQWFFCALACFNEPLSPYLIEPIKGPFNMTRTKST